MIGEFLRAEGIDCFGELSRRELVFSDEKRLSRLEERMGRVESAVLFLMPYFAGEAPTNLSYYARPLDYHGFVKELSERLKGYLEERGEALDFALLADTSPLQERLCAARAGLGVLGDNGLLIHPRYGSYVFIGAILLSRPIAPAPAVKEGECLRCGACARACPTAALREGKREECLSHLTQKKKRTPEEDALIRRGPYRWGCDLCQTVCPMNRKAEVTPIPYFLKDRLESLLPEHARLPEEEFACRAFSWRGREIIEKNLSVKGEET